MARAMGSGGRALGRGYFGKKAERTKLEILQEKITSVGQSVEETGENGGQLRN